MILAQSGGGVWYDCRDQESHELVEKIFKTNAVALAHVNGPQSLVSFCCPLRPASNVNGNRIDDLADRVTTIEATNFKVVLGLFLT